MPAVESPSTELQAIKADLAALRDDMGSLSKSLLRDGARKARAARAAAEQKLTDASETVEEFVQERPFTTIAVAFAAGAVVSALLCRR